MQRLEHAPSRRASRVSGATGMERSLAAAFAPAGTRAGQVITEDSRSSDIAVAGARIGQYELIRELGRGGMGAVYLARDTRLGRRVALKLLHSQQPELTARFLVEARATAQCSHENIVIIYEVGEHAGSPFMALEYLQGSPLSTLLRDRGALPPSRAVELMVPVVRALVCAHEHGIVHRDLKPENIFVTDAGAVKVLDFGIAKVLGETQPVELAGGDESVDSRAGAELTRRGALVGTLAYMSPEQWRAAHIDHRTDLWAVGIILFKMVAGRHPLAPLQGRELMVTGLMDRPMPRVRDACPELPDELAAVIDACLIKPREQRIATARELLAVLEPMLPGHARRSLPAGESPYAGLSSFQEADADRFFGRSQDIAAAVARLRDRPLLGVVGPSGVGKSSFVRAGVVPALKTSGESWTALVVRPGRRPVAALAHLIAPMVGTSTSTVAEELSAHDAVSERLYEEPGYVGSVLRARARQQGRRMVLFVDQMEELYTLGAELQERLAFTACLASIADDATAPLRVIVSIRSDFLDRVAEDQRFMAELVPGLYFLTPPNRSGLRDALTQPAEMAGYQLESVAMVEHMLDHLEHTPGALPLLQFAAARLWEMRDRDRRMLTEASYRAIGGIAGALASHADTVVGELSPRAQILARSLLLRLVTSERTRAVVSMDELCELGGDAGEVQRLIDQLVAARLLVVQTGDGESGSSVEIVHESLIHSWPLLGKWLDESQDDAAFLEQLRNAARQWQTKGRPAGLLWRGEAMEEARRWHKRYRGELPELQKQYLQAVFALATRATRWRRLALVGVIVVLSGFLAAAAVALVIIREAQQEATVQAAMARQAEKQARAQYKELQAKEQARAEAAKQALEAEQQAREAARLAQEAEQQAREAQAVAEKAGRELRGKNAALSEALDKAEQAKRRARRARRLALLREAEALAARNDVEALLERERERLRQLEEQLGSGSLIRDVPLR